MIKRMCLYCGCDVALVDVEGVCNGCRDVNDEQFAEDDDGNDDDYCHCDFCGARIHQDDSYYLDSGDTACGDCVSCCDICNNNFYHEHMHRCENCDDFVCEYCSKKCKVCGSVFCNDCLTEDVCNECEIQQLNQMAVNNVFLN